MNKKKKKKEPYPVELFLTCGFLVFVNKNLSHYPVLISHIVCEYKTVSQRCFAVISYFSFLLLFLILTQKFPKPPSMNNSRGEDGNYFLDFQKIFVCNFPVFFFSKIPNNPL